MKRPIFIITLCGLAGCATAPQQQNMTQDQWNQLFLLGVMSGMNGYNQGMTIQQQRPQPAPKYRCTDGGYSVLCRPY